MSTTLPRRTAERLAKVLGKLGSDHDGERAAAGLLAHRLVRDANLSWEDVVLSTALPSPMERRPPSADILRHIGQARWILSRAAMLSEWERSFCHSMLGWRGRPTERQQAILRDVVRKVEASMREACPL